MLLVFVCLFACWCGFCFLFFCLLFVLQTYLSDEILVPRASNISSWSCQSKQCKIYITITWHERVFLYPSHLSNSTGWQVINGNNKIIQKHTKSGWFAHILLVLMMISYILPIHVTAGQLFTCGHVFVVSPWMPLCHTY